MTSKDHEVQPSDGLFVPRGNPRHIFERRETPLCFMQPYYNPTIHGPQRLPNHPQRITPEVRRFRGEEVLAHGARGRRDIRHMEYEYKDRIKAAADRDKAVEAEKSKTNYRMRWWHTRHAVDDRDLLKTMKFNNYTFNPTTLLNAQEVVILNLTGCTLGDEQMPLVSTAIEQNATLRRLVLQGNKLTATGCENLREGLRRSSSITDLDMSLNPIGDNGLNSLLSAFSENRRNTKISKLNVSTCDLSPNSGYHLARLIRDFKSVEVVLAWRNRIGDPCDSDVAGVGLIFEELALTKSLKFIDLSANNISESDCAKHATVMEQQARAIRLAEVVKRNRVTHIQQLETQIAEMQLEELWEDQKVILAGLQRELLQERQKYAQQLEDDAKAKRLKTKDFEWMERVKKLTGRELADPKVQLRLVLNANHSVTPMTISRLSQFYDLNSRDDTHDWLNLTRRYDLMLHPRRNVGDAYEFRTAEESAADPQNPWDFDADMRRVEEEARAERTKELEVMRKKGVVASAVLEERLRGKTPHGSGRPATGVEGSTSSRTASPHDNTLRVTTRGASRRPTTTTGGGTTSTTTPLAGADHRTATVTVTTEEEVEVGDDDEVKLTMMENTARQLRETRGGSRVRTVDVVNPAASPLGNTVSGDGLEAEQSDAALFSNATANVTRRADVQQRRATRRTGRSNKPRSEKSTVGMSAARMTRTRSKARDLSPGNDSGWGSGAEYTSGVDSPRGGWGSDGGPTAVTIGGEDDDEDDDGPQILEAPDDDGVAARDDGSSEDGDDDVAAYDGDAFFANADDDNGDGDTGLQDLMRTLNRPEKDPAVEMQKKLEERMQAVRERVESKRAPVATTATANLNLGSSSTDAVPPEVVVDGAPEEEETSGVTVQANPQTGALELVMKTPRGDRSAPVSARGGVRSNAASPKHGAASPKRGGPVIPDQQEAQTLPEEQQQPQEATGSQGEAGGQDTHSAVDGGMEEGDDEEGVVIQELPPELAESASVARTLLMEGIAKVRELWANIVALSEIGSPTDSDLELLAAEKEKCGNFKVSFARQLEEYPATASFSEAQQDKVEEVIAFVDELIRESDRTPGVTPLVEALFTKVALPWHQLVDERSFAASAAADGSLEIVRAIMKIPNVTFDILDVLCSCFYNQQVRVPLAHIVLSAGVLDLSSVAEDLQFNWQEFFEDIASTKRAIPREDRALRMDVLKRMLQEEALTVDVEVEGNDGQSCFSRACLEGDEALVTLLLESGKVTDLNVVRGDRMNALHSAVIGNSVGVVKKLLGAGTINVNEASPNGTPLDMALLLQRDGNIAAALRAAGATGTSKSAGKKPKPKGKAGVSVGAKLAPPSSKKNPTATTAGSSKGAPTRGGGRKK